MLFGSFTCFAVAKTENRIVTATSKVDGALQPTYFDYEKFELKNSRRYWWLYGFEPKWYLSPFPQTEVNKGYGLVQNPGW